MLKDLVFIAAAHHHRAYSPMRVQLQPQNPRIEFSGLRKITFLSFVFPEASFWIGRSHSPELVSRSDFDFTDHLEYRP